MLMRLLALSLSISSPACAFDELLVQPPTSLADECVNGLVEHRIDQWKRRDRPPASGAFANVEEIARDVDPPALRALAERGCSRRYRHLYLSCTQVDWPENASPALRPMGVSAETEAEMLRVMRGCLADLKKAGVPPAGKR
ncbi:hypothetical protein MBUL_01281 [Methylobacterium bullatum]|uniref:Lysozyme inhibitor LprI N-terminal domain-containing protein n=1 Tax=Methylobacterium bullatum TaxID=570505 RepID=A0A679IZB3_9HYPH|nr:hypothetical protein MBUL_01281 [Methylobacterium bullatum]